MTIATRMAPAEQKAFYDERGYILHPDLVTQDELATLRAALDEVLEEARGLTETNDKFSVTRGADGNYHVRRIFNPIKHHQAFYEMAFHPRILDAVEALIGPNIQFHHSKLNMKPPTTPDARFEWHQDYPFYPHTNYDLLAVLIHLDEATKENGCLRIVPGSHKHGPQMHVFARDGAFSSKLADQAVIGEESSWFYAEAPAGGVEIHHCNMLHSSTANLGARPRSVLIFNYRAADNVALGGTTSHHGFGMMMRGTNPYRARMLDGTLINLPGEIKDPLQRDG